MKTIRQVAENIARDLLQGSNLKPGKRLQIKLWLYAAGGPEQDGGGYCETAIVDLILRHLPERRQIKV